MKRKKGLYTAAEIDASPQLATELLAFSNENLDIDQQIQILRDQKADLFERMRDASFDPAHAKAWSAEKLKDEEKEAIKREKRTEAALIVETLAATETAKGRAGARARNAAKAAGQEKFDAETGEVLGDAPAPAVEDAALATDEVMAGSGNFSPAAAAETNRITRAIAESFGRGAETTTATSGPAKACAPYRIEPRIPEPAPEMPDLPAFLDRSRKAEAAE